MRDRLRMLMNLIVPLTLTVAAAHQTLQAQSASKDPMQQSRSADLMATSIAGLPDVKPNVKGRLSLDQVSLTFTNADVHASIPLKRIETVSIGAESYEPGGTAGAISRQAIPFGGGPALGAVQGKTVDVMAVEYRDLHDGYHGAVFILPKEQAADIQKRLEVSISPLPQATAASCEAERTKTSVLLSPIKLSGLQLPAEYRVLLYEQLFTELRQAHPANTYFRAGDVTAGSGCTAMTLTVDVNAFTKGNAHLRGSTGPVGMFVGSTSIGYTVVLTNHLQKVLFRADLKNKHRFDTQSLGLAEDVAKSVSKRMDKEVKSIS